MSALCVVWILR